MTEGIGRNQEVTGRIGCSVYFSITKNQNIGFCRTPRGGRDRISPKLRREGNFYIRDRSPRIVFNQSPERHGGRPCCNRAQRPVRIIRISKAVQCSRTCRSRVGQKIGRRCSRPRDPRPIPPVDRIRGNRAQTDLNSITRRKNAWNTVRPQPVKILAVGIAVRAIQRNRCDRRGCRIIDYQRDRCAGHTCGADGDAAGSFSVAGGIIHSRSLKGRTS